MNLIKHENGNLYREDMPEMPERISNLPVRRGYPVPWFVSFVNGDYDFRVADAQKKVAAVRHSLCWICGEKLGATLVFAIGPMCAVNRINSEPPSHRECAEFAVKACPFLIQQQVKYRENNMPEGAQPAPGFGIKRQPGAVLLWITDSFKLFDAGNGVLFQLGEPLKTLWFREGRAATREEALESINSGIPILLEAAENDGPLARYKIMDAVRKAMFLLPPEGTPKKRFLGSASKRNAV